MNNKVTYRQQFTRCGKQRCRKCRDGAGHGPYWYAYWSENGRTVSKYIGIQPPVEMEVLTPSGAGVGGQAIASPVHVPYGTREDSSSANGHESSRAGSSRHMLPDTQILRFAQDDSGVERRDDKPVLRVYLLGQFRIEHRNGEEWEAITNRTWHRRRARALLGCLLSIPGRRLGREQAMEALWPDLNIETAANRLNGAVHELRQILEPGIARPASSQMLRLERDVLKLADASQIWVDAEAFEGLLNKANTLSNPEAVERILEEAALLYDGDYLLEELYSEWAAPRREALRRAWMGLLLDLADLRAARGALTSAIEPLDRLLVTDPTHETAVRRLMVLLTQLDRRGEALRIYQQLASLLRRDYDADPLPETRELYEALKQGHIPAAVLHVPANMQFQQRAPEDSPVKQDLLTSQDFFSPLLASVGSARQLGRHNQSPLVGRDKELDVMRRLLSMIEQLSTPEGIGSGRAPMRDAQLQEGLRGRAGSSAEDRGGRSCHFLLLMGEAGIGKTRLAEELSQEADKCGWLVAWSRAYEQEGTIPYRPWTEVLRTLLQQAPSEFLVSVLGSQFNGSDVGAGSEISTASTRLRPTYTTLKRLSALLPELTANEQDAAALTSDRSLPGSGSVADSRLHLWEATLGLLRVLSRTAPILIVLDDLHWTDDSSLELLAYLARHLQDERILLIGTCRDAELAPTSTFRGLVNDLRREQAIVSLPIQPLTRSQIGSLVAHLPKEIVRSIQTQAGGNPFFAEELARVSEASLHASTSSNGEAELPTRNLFLHDSTKEEFLTIPGEFTHVSTLPESIAAVLERRLNRLSSDCQALLGKAAVLGGSFEFHQLLYMVASSDRLQSAWSQGSSASDEDTVLDLLEEALAAGLLTEESKGTHITYHFWHPLIVSHLYERLSAARRAQLHRRAANALLHLHPGRKAEVAAAITYHLSKGGSDASQIARYAEIAGNRAFSLSAYSEAQYYYRQAISALSEESSSPSSTAEEDPLHLACLLERVAECSKLEGNYEEVRHLYERALELRNSHRIDSSEFKDEGEFQAWRQQEAQIQALIWREIGRTWAANSEYARARQCYIHGKQVMNEAGITSGTAWACLHLQYGNICRLEGNYEEAHRCAQEALEVLESAMQDRQMKGDQPQVTIAKKSTYPTLETRTARSLLGDPLEVGQAHEILGVIEVSTGQFTESLKHLKIALDIFEQHDLVMAMAQVCGNLGAVHAFKAENTIARTYYRRSLELAERMGDLPNMAFVTGNLGDVAARSGDLLEAEEWFKRSLELSEHVDDREHKSWCNVALATALQDQGNLRGALECIRRALAFARAMKSTRCTGFALVALGDLRVTQAISVRALQTTDSTENVIKDFGDAHVAQNAACKQFLLRAKRALERALSLETLEVEAMMEGQLVLASVYFMLGDLQTARHKALQTMEAAGEHELTRVLARSHRLLGRILAAQGDYEAADGYFEQAIAVFREYEMRLDYARSLHGYGVTLLQRSAADSEMYSRGLAYLVEAREVFANCKAAIDLKWVERVLASL